ncbi:uncharacterized protein LOC134841210 [Symsagittifera roscoffensis]|uniref:uncharacterized protein LOC134841210 n=1 Tax=Symsagittifera roscoffensis TaxID=84072 RepID=UPI00307BF675
MRKLKYATSVEKKNSLNCDLEKGQKCMLSKLQVLVRHFKDVDKVEKMNLYYSYSKVNFSLQQLQSAEEAGNNGWFWNVGFFSKPKSEQKISLEALGHFFIQYTSQEQDREFYRQVVNMIDPERDLDAPKRFGQNDLKPENSGENNSEEK